VYIADIRITSAEPWHTLSLSRALSYSLLRHHTYIRLLDEESTVLLTELDFVDKQVLLTLNHSLVRLSLHMIPHFLVLSLFSLSLCLSVCLSLSLSSLCPPPPLSRHPCLPQPARSPPPSCLLLSHNCFFFTCSSPVQSKKLCTTYKRKRTRINFLILSTSTTSATASLQLNLENQANHQPPFLFPFRIQQ
jgi:hypothetical protein